MEIRKPNLSLLSEAGIPQDFQGSMELFNRLLEERKLENCPRKTKITVEEVKTLWVPSAQKNITFVAEVDGVIVASGTLFVDEKSNEYSRESGRGQEFASTFDPQFVEAGKEVTRAVIQEAKRRRLTFISHTAVDDEVNVRIMEDLGYSPTKMIENYERYTRAGVSGKVYEYVIS